MGIRGLSRHSFLAVALFACQPRSTPPGAPASPLPPPASAVVTPGRPGYYVEGRHLYDRCGERVVLRGINEMIIWSPNKNGTPEFAEIAKTGANVVRIVWTTEGDAAALDRAVANALAAQLIALVELHDATGEFAKLGMLVDYWTRADVVAVLKMHEHALLLNVGNEVGNGDVPAADWENGYVSALERLRATGIRVPIIIDAPRWGQDIDRLQASGPRVIAADPLKNTMLSVHTWWPEGDAARIQRELEESVKLELPLLVGEFGPYAVHECPRHVFDYPALLAHAQRLEIGWLAWSWGGVKNRDCPGMFDMTRDGNFETLEGWGLNVAVSDPNSIQKTSKRPKSMTLRRCEARAAK